MRMFCAALSRDGSLGSLSPDRNLGVSPPSKLDKLRCEPIFVSKHLDRRHICNDTKPPMVLTLLRAERGERKVYWKV